MTSSLRGARFFEERDSRSSSPIRFVATLHQTVPLAKPTPFFAIPCQSSPGSSLFRATGGVHFLVCAGDERKERTNKSALPTTEVCRLDFHAMGGCLAMCQDRATALASGPLQETSWPLSSPYRRDFINAAPEHPSQLHHNTLCDVVAQIGKSLLASRNHPPSCIAWQRVCVSLSANTDYLFLRPRSRLLRRVLAVRCFNGR